MSEIRQAASPRAIQMKNRRNTISTEEKLDVVSRLEEGKLIVDVWRDVRLADGSVRTVCVNDDRVTGNVKLGTKLLCIARLPQCCRKGPYQI